MTKEARLSRRDESMVDLLIRTGMSKNIAKATGLRQPEVSIAMQELRRRRWVEKRDIKKEGKGRPVHAYRLATPFDGIIDNIAREERAKIDEIETNIRKMRSQVP